MKEMMLEKDGAMKKIHVLGKIGRIVTKVLSIFVKIAIVCAIVSHVLVMVAIGQGTSVSVSRENVFTVTVPDSKNSVVQIGNIDSEDGFLSYSEHGVQYNFEVTQIDDNTVQLLSSQQPKGFGVVQVSIIFVLAELMLVATVVCLNFGNKLATELETCDSPFQADVISYMKKFSISLIPWAVCDTTFKTTMVAFMTGANNVSVNVDFGCIIAVLIVILLTTIFRYGAILQQESDETL